MYETYPPKPMLSTEIQIENDKNNPLAQHKGQFTDNIMLLIMVLVIEG